MSEWSSRIAAQRCTVQQRRLVRMRFLYQPIIPLRMVAMGFLSRRSESLVLCGRTEAANAITEVFDEKSGRFDAAASRLRKNWRGEVFFAFRRSPNSNRLCGLLTTYGAGWLASSPPPDGLAAASCALIFCRPAVSASIAAPLRKQSAPAACT
jgi:hypothetical protein